MDYPPGVTPITASLDIYLPGGSAARKPKPQPSARPKAPPSRTPSYELNFGEYLERKGRPRRKPGAQTQLKWSPTPTPPPPTKTPARAPDSGDEASSADRAFVPPQTILRMVLPSDRTPMGVQGGRMSPRASRTLFGFSSFATSRTPSRMAALSPPRDRAPTGVKGSRTSPRAQDAVLRSGGNMPPENESWPMPAHQDPTTAASSGNSGVPATASASTVRTVDSWGIPHVRPPGAPCPWGEGTKELARAWRAIRKHERNYDPDTDSDESLDSPPAAKRRRVHMDPAAGSEVRAGTHAAESSTAETRDEETMYTTATFAAVDRDEEVDEGHDGVRLTRMLTMRGRRAARKVVEAG
ncbi:hypothetical protein AURDEDRAFT_125558 [Auricularia subglabra TFB-10046 SS5]|nr:hypothetical protein AURDEDRAFT_125558 [Auricularia subglabra TFB-10046 SS5]